MIARLTGTVVEKAVSTVVLDVSGVGYEIAVPMTTMLALSDQAQQTTLFTHFVVREDAQQLFGFIHKKDRDLFRHLIKVSGIGARTALAMLSAMDTHTVVHSIISSDVAMLAKVPGIGKKTAERVIVEMRDKLNHWAADATLLDTAGQTALSQQAANLNQGERDAIAALIALGYKSVESSRVIKNVAKPGMSSEELIRLSLQSMVTK